MSLCNHDFISTIVTVNGIWLGFISTMYSNILAISKSSTINLLQASPAKNNKSRFDEFLEEIKLTCLVNFIAIVLGILLLSDFYLLFDFFELSKLGAVIKTLMFIAFVITEILALIKMYNLYDVSHAILNYYGKSKKAKEENKLNEFIEEQEKKWGKGNETLFNKTLKNISKTPSTTHQTSDEHVPLNCNDTQTL